MDTYSSVEAVLQRAILLEDEAATMYTAAAQATRIISVRKRLEEMAEQERGHKARLEEILAGNVRWAIRRSRAEPAPDLRLSDHLEAGSMDPNADYQDVLLAAARREKVAHDFYQAMGEFVADPIIKGAFEMLANEERRHKYEVEKTYEEVVYQAF